MCTRAEEKFWSEKRKFGNAFKTWSFSTVKSRCLSSMKGMFNLHVLFCTPDKKVKKT